MTHPGPMTTSRSHPPATTTAPGRRPAPGLPRPAARTPDPAGQPGHHRAAGPAASRRPRRGPAPAPHPATATGTGQP